MLLGYVSGMVPWLGDQETKPRWPPGIGRGRVGVRRLNGRESPGRLSGDFQDICHRLGDILEVGNLGVRVEDCCEGEGRVAWAKSSQPYQATRHCRKAAELKR